MSKFWCKKYRGGLTGAGNDGEVVWRIFKIGVQYYEESGIYNYDLETK